MQKLCTSMFLLRLFFNNFFREEGNKKTSQKPLTFLKNNLHEGFSPKLTVLTTKML